MSYGLDDFRRDLRERVPEAWIVLIFGPLAAVLLLSAAVFNLLYFLG